MKDIHLSPAVRLSLIYLTISVIWILVSDEVLDALIKDQRLLSTLQTLKGWGFVLFTSLLIYRLSRRDMEQMEHKNQQLEEWGHKLESRVDERTAELSAANKRLQSLDNFKSKMISEISHELRSPITSIGLKVELMERVDPVKRMQYVTELKEQILTLRELLNDVTDIALMEHDEIAGEVSKVNMNRLTRQVVDEHRPLAEATGLKLDFEETPDIPAVPGRYNHLARMLANLVTNAIKYTNQGIIQVILSTDLEQQVVVIQVQDSGIGITPDSMEHLFDRFYRSERVKNRNIPGSGLGLSIVKDIVEAHQGSISVESTLDVGSTFTVRLPLTTSQISD